MDNDAFKKLVRDRTGGKSTKEIARAAVEAEFKKKKKRQRGGGGDYSSDSDDDQQKSKKKPLLARPRQVRGSNKDEEDEDDKDTALDLNYRDRAKERREGKEGQHQVKLEDGDDESGMLQDKIIPNNTRGLDLSLARKLKEEFQGAGSTSQVEKTATIQPFETVEEAKELLKEFSLKEESRPPGMDPSMVEYLIELAEIFCYKVDATAKKPPKTVGCGVAGKSIQRSRLAMAMEGHVSDFRRAWEIPREIIQPQIWLKEVPQMPSELLEKIDRVFVRRKSNHVPSITNLLAAKTQRGARTVAKGSAAPSNTPTGKDEVKDSSQNNANNTDDDDDDIFGGLDEYVPPKRSST